jgi:hypothetical protein
MDTLQRVADFPVKGTLWLFSLSPEEKGIVVFHLWPSLPYVLRITIALVLIGAGMIIQALIFRVWPGALLVLCGSLLLCVRGYHHRVESGHFSPQAAWENADVSCLSELQEMEQKILDWNRSFMDVTNLPGVVTLFLVVAPAGYIFSQYLLFDFILVPTVFEILAFDLVFLLVPHWLTGLRRALRLPKLMVKVEALNALIQDAQNVLDTDQMTVMLLRQGSSQVPLDIKLKIRKPGSREDFYGVFVQVVTNDVNGTSFPYVYAVLAARPGYGLDKVQVRGGSPEGVITEYAQKNEVETLVVRQQTTKKGGYHTKPPDAARILCFAIQLAEGRTE